MSIIKNIGNFFGAIGYYISTLLFALFIAIGIITLIFVSSYNDLSEDYAKIQIAWNNVDNDIAQDLKVIKEQLSLLKQHNNENNLYYTETNKNLMIIDSTIQNIDNAMTYQQKLSIYPEIINLVNDIEVMTEYLEIEEDNFDKEQILQNNESLKQEYNILCNKMNAKIKSKKYQMIVNAFNFHTWTQIP